MNWIIEQTWNHVLFLHWRIKAEQIQPHLPYALDLFEGDAVISIVPFQMNRIRFPWSPAVPFLSSLWELNLRTYVNIGGKRGVYFFTLDTDSSLGSFIANHLFNLPYRVGKLDGVIKNGHYSFASQRADCRFEIKALVLDKPKVISELDFWATERYFVFTHSKTQHFSGQVVHEPWQLREVKLLEFKDQFSSQVGLNLNYPPDEISYCPELKVRFKPFKRNLEKRPELI